MMNTNKNTETGASGNDNFREHPYNGSTSGNGPRNAWQTSGRYRYDDNDNNYENDWNKSYDNYSYSGEWQNDPEGYNSAFNEGDDIDEGYYRGNFPADGNGGRYHSEPDDDRDYYDTGSYRSQGRHPQRYEEDFVRNGSLKDRFSENRYPDNDRFNERQNGYRQDEDRREFREGMGPVSHRNNFEYRDDYYYIPDSRRMDNFYENDFHEEQDRTNLRGFAAMDPEEVRRIARLGGLASHKNDARTQRSKRFGSGHENSKSHRGFANMPPAEVRQIARPGGLASQKNDNKPHSSSSMGRRTRSVSASLRTRSTTSSASKRSGSLSISVKSKRSVSRLGKKS